MDCCSRIEHVFIHPGEFLIATSECTVHTVLGSSVSIVLWHLGARVGAISHAVIPTRENNGQFPLSSRYGDEVLPLMLRELERAGINPLECEARIYGGGNVSPADARAFIQNIGRENGEMARRQLAGYGIPVVAESLFDKCYRKIEFNVGSGKVFVARLPVSDTLLREA